MKIMKVQSETDELDHIRRTADLSTKAALMKYEVLRKIQDIECDCIFLDNINCFYSPSLLTVELIFKTTDTKQWRNAIQWMCREWKLGFDRHLLQYLGIFRFTCRMEYTDKLVKMLKLPNGSSLHVHLDVDEIEGCRIVRQNYTAVRYVSSCNAE